jgi:hypothetical protein
LKRSFFVAALAGIAVVSLPFASRAQVSSVARPVQIGVALGAAIPTSDMSDVVSTGFNATATVGFTPEMIPLGIRIDGAYNQFGVQRLFGGGNLHFTSVTGNLVYKAPGATISPYGIGGAGWYNVGASGGGGSSNHFGWNIGGGILMPLSGFDTFIEARYYQVQGSAGSSKFFPVTFGILF